jgi:cysteine-S-conjugate beta-lyase
VSFDFDAPVDRAGSWSIRWDRYAGRDVIPLWVADSDFRAPQAVLDAMAERTGHGIFGYTEPPQALRNAIVERLARLYAWRIDPSWIVFLPGVVPGLHLAARRLPAGHAIVPTPVYQHLKRAPQLAGRAISEVPLVLQAGRWVWDEDALKKGMRNDTALVFLCNPQNPGGTVFTRAELLRLAEATADAVIVCDEIHCDLVLEPGRQHVPIASLSPEISRRCVTLMSPNKAFNFPAAGCAYAIAENARLRGAMAEEMQAHVLPSPSVFGYVAALAAYGGGDAWLAAQLAYLRANRDLVEARIGLPAAHVEATYLAWIDCSPLGMDDPWRFFLDRGVALTPGAQFGDARFVRLNFGTQRARLEEALRRISKAARPPRAAPAPR